ncbi:MAG TPA: MBL fold metallo-hydrolase [Chloroflexota bacterium]
MRIERLVLTSAESNCWLVGSEPAREALVIDPGEDPARVAGRLAELGWRPTLIVITHAHWDHVNACAELATRFGAEVAMHPADSDLLRLVPEVTLERTGARGPQPPVVGRLLADGDVVGFGDEQLRIWHTPGHTPGSVCLLGDGLVFSGDTLMAGWVGRTDRPGGDQPAIRASLWDRLLTLPDDTRVYAGHLEVTTIGVERRDNPYLTEQLPLR